MSNQMVFGITIHESAAYDINTTVCLKTAVKFIREPGSCSFSSSYAKTLLEDEHLYCSKCNVYVFNLDDDNTYMHRLHRVCVTIGTEQKFTKSSCQSSHKRRVSMHIECSSWNQNTYRVMNTTECELSSATCEKIDKYCICYCYPGYVTMNGPCLKGNLTVGHTCKYDMQCTGTEFADVCYNGRCGCQSGYILNGTNCYPENVTVGHLCLHDRQCTGTKRSGLCSHDVCTCQAGYILIDNTCYQENLTVGHTCSNSMQCTETEFASVCNNRRCECQSGYILNGSNCYLVHSNESGRSIGNQQDHNIESILGILFGGIILGVIFTAVIAILIVKKIRTNIKKREEPVVMCANERLYNFVKVVEHEDNKVCQTNDETKRVVNVSPITCQERGPIYSSMTRNTRVEQPMEDVYNHLREEEKHETDEDHYDHACAASYLGREPPSIYSSIP